MNQEVIQDFLNLPGIAGVALMDGRSRPYFCGVDRSLNFQQKEALAQGILQVVETIPEGFESFEFQFTGHQVHIYKLEHGVILLVLIGEGFVYSDYIKIIQKLKVALRADISNAIAGFRLSAGSITLSGIKYGKSSSPATPTLHSSTNGSALKSSDRASAAPASPPTSSNGSQRPASPPPAPVPQPTVAAAPPPAVSQEACLKDVITALNQLSKFTTQYLGTHVIANYWKSTQPDHDWIKTFKIERSAQITLANSTPQELQRPLSSEEQQWIQRWVNAFIQRCSQVIRDFPLLIEQKALDATQKKLLMGG